jgi:hypothetical protein
MTPANQDYRALAEECLRKATEVTDKAAASWFRMLAADYLELAERAVSRPTEIRQSETEDEKGNRDDGDDR